MNKTVVNQGGVSGLSLLVLLFIGLKLTGFIEWSWWWVTAPLWIPRRARDSSSIPDRARISCR